MHESARNFIARFATDSPLAVLEIGGRNLNGTVRDLFPGAHWTALDLLPGPGVDLVCDFLDFTPPGPLDLIVCCEVLEHAEHWREIVHRAAAFLATGGRLLITCAGPARAPHSGIDGGHVLHAGEHYANIAADELFVEMVAAGLWASVETPVSLLDTHGMGVRRQLSSNP